jgi:hypothetical protein
MSRNVQANLKIQKLGQNYFCESHWKKFHLLSPNEW